MDFPINSITLVFRLIAFIYIFIFIFPVSYLQQHSFAPNLFSARWIYLPAKKNFAKNVDVGLMKRCVAEQNGIGNSCYKLLNFILQT
jgi:hypothetical protein